ncbi:hypothetical protein SODALDRAFT_364327 [Sodiomyces alkalinus F11]|uniref:Uncharacterized protein n=1 Tax=Sodiomyces alkalinus (strain CBS 110278 / VKM F-3762 / F11) TaxID=1314773 RepID=A0A3N2PJ47_SODAK|nr:hypothetical protein SODALDRAFT_364327 [Sodiomyces alkalinus F11]ROT34562.1 hypothetical protein SODALDRAFT_364327 [Sodiomyces alkalinus F11]
MHAFEMKQSETTQESNTERARPGAKENEWNGIDGPQGSGRAKREKERVNASPEAQTGKSPSSLESQSPHLKKAAEPREEAQPPDWGIRDPWVRMTVQEFLVPLRVSSRGIFLVPLAGTITETPWTMTAAHDDADGDRMDEAVFSVLHDETAPVGAKSERRLTMQDARCLNSLNPGRVTEDRLGHNPPAAIYPCSVVESEKRWDAILQFRDMLSSSKWPASTTEFEEDGKNKITDDRSSQIP